MVTQNINSSSITAGLIGASLTLAVVYVYQSHFFKDLKQGKKDGNDARSSLLEMKEALSNSGTIKPPLPSVVQSLLSSAHLAYLSTSDISNESSHLSLMRFTYIPGEEVIIMSTRRDTKKFDLLEKQQGVALLVHDFGNDEKENFSITLNGTCSIVEISEEVERYRAKHLEHNPDYPQFIVGANIAILCVRVLSASVCNIHDQVRKWDISSGSSALI